MINRLKLAPKLIVLFLLMAMLVAVTGSIGLWTINKIGELDIIRNSNGALGKLAVHMKSTLQECQAGLHDALTTQGTLDDFDLAKADYEIKRDTFMGYFDLITKGSPKLGIQPARKGEALERKVLEIKKNFKDLTFAADGLLNRKVNQLQGRGSVSPQAKQGNSATPESLLAEMDRIATALDDILVVVTTQSAAAEKESSTIRRQSTYLFMLAITLSFMLATVLGLMHTRGMIKRINRIASAMHRGAEGDLAARVSVDSGDELGMLSHDFNVMTGKLSQTVVRVKKTIVELSQVGKTILTVSRHVMQSAETQKNNVHETSSAIVEINQSHRDVTQSVTELSKLSANTFASTQAIATSIADIADIAGALSSSVDEVSTSIVQMGSNIKQIGQSINTLASGSERTAHAIIEMDVSIKQVEQNARQTAQISEIVRKDAEVGKEAVEATIAGIDEIHRSSRITSEVIETLSGKVKDIGLILSVIDSVAKQTNLLALNAAVIAAHARENGKGFAVVADETKQLADRTRDKTREIALLIQGVKDETDRAVRTIEHAEKKITEGATLSRQSGEVLSRIVTGVQAANAQIENIANATHDQAKESRIIREAMGQVSDMICQIGAATHEQGRAGEQIMAAVMTMAELIKKVKMSTEKQSREGNYIAGLTENMNDMVLQIQSACEEQDRVSEQIMRAIVAIENSARDNLKSTKVMDETVSALTGQTEILEEQISGFVMDEG